MKYDDIKKAWNAQADEHNQWDELCEDEKIEWAARFGAEKERAARKKAQEEFLNFKGTGMSVMEMSHRSKEFEAVLARALDGVKNVMGVPDDYSIILVQGGASMRVTIGGEAPDGAQADSDAEPWTLEEAVRALSRRLYRQLNEQTKKSISDGL